MTKAAATAALPPRMKDLRFIRPPLFVWSRQLSNDSAWSFQGVSIDEFNETARQLAAASSDNSLGQQSEPFMMIKLRHWNFSSRWRRAQLQPDPAPTQEAKLPGGRELR